VTRYKNIRVKYSTWRQLNRIKKRIIKETGEKVSFDDVIRILLKR